MHGKWWNPSAVIVCCAVIEATPPADVDAIQEILLRISRLVEDVPEIHELDLNPIFALSPGKGCSIVDARIRV